jgi:DNA mismatch endonuclease (patch repair protein)
MPRKATRAETEVRRIVRSLGMSFRYNVRSLPGTPDLASKRHQFAIFVNGCFWHGHAGCEKAMLPSSNRWWWRAKIEDNRMRDRRKERELKDLGYRVLVVWGCELRDVAKLRRKLAAATAHLCR